MTGGGATSKTSWIASPELPDSIDNQKSRKGSADHCVVSSFEYFDADEMDHEIEDIEESDFQFQAESFEAFLWRFWIENEILFAQHDSTPPPDVDPRFLKLYAQPGHNKMM